MSPGLWQGTHRRRRERRLAAGERRPEGGRRRRPVGAEGVRRPGLDRRRARAARRGDPRRGARLEDGIPDLRLVREGRVAEGRGWIGLADREAYQLRDIRQVDLAPGWLSLILAAGLVFAAWRIEGR